MYDATIGRFFSQDPIGIEAGDANFYRYVKNAPVNSSDPSGLDTQARIVEKAGILYVEGAANPLANGSVGLVINQKDGRKIITRTIDKKTYCLTYSQVVYAVRTDQAWKSEEWDRYFKGVGYECDITTGDPVVEPPARKPSPAPPPAANNGQCSAQCDDYGYVEETLEPSLVEKMCFGAKPNKIRAYFSPNTPENREIAKEMLRTAKLLHSLGQLKTDVGAVITAADVTARGVRCGGYF